MFPSVPVAIQQPIDSPHEVYLRKMPPSVQSLSPELTALCPRGLIILSRNASCTSGFDFPEKLHQYGISKDIWEQFTRVICEESKLSRQQWIRVVGKGLGAFALGTVIFGVFGAIPAVLVTKHAQARQEQRNLLYKMAGLQGEVLSFHIAQWNESFFRSAGVRVRVDLPYEHLEDLEELNFEISGSSNGLGFRESAASRTRIVITPLIDRKHHSEE